MLFRSPPPPSKVEKTLMVQQQRSEFLPTPGPGSSGMYDKATPACMLVCALLQALHSSARANLAGANLQALLYDVGGEGGPSCKQPATCNLLSATAFTTTPLQPSPACPPPPRSACACMPSWS